MPHQEDRHVVWERRQTELWDRIFQVTQDVVTLAKSLDDSLGEKIVQEQLVTSAMRVGADLVRANAADVAVEFEKYVKEARMQAIETDYWLRLIFVLQQRDDVQRDLSSVISQYATIITMLQKFLRHAHGEANVLAKHARRGKVSL